MLGNYCSDLLRDMAVSSINVGAHDPFVWVQFFRNRNTNLCTLFSFAHKQVFFIEGHGFAPTKVKFV